MNDEPPIIYGDGTKTRDFTFIDDVVEANVTLLEEDAADGEALNIGLTDNIAIKTLAEEIRDQVAPELELVFEERHDADAEHTHADMGNPMTSSTTSQNTRFVKALGSSSSGIVRTRAGTNRSSETRSWSSVFAGKMVSALD